MSWNNAFIDPGQWTPNTAVRAFTTTRLFPESAAAPRWPAPASAKGAAIENDYNEHGCPLSLWLPAAPLWLEQVHGNRVVDLDTLTDIRNHPPKADAALTRRPDTVLAIVTADCLPVVFADDQGEVIAAAHAGWRGLVSGVLEATVAAMRTTIRRQETGDGRQKTEDSRRETGDGRPVEVMQESTSAISAWLGPAIGPAAFEVGDDVRDAFLSVCAADADCFSVGKDTGKWFADLYALARRRLGRCGITRISGGGFCTFTDKQRFYSYRREKDAGRMATFVYRDQESGIRNQ